LTLLLSFSLQTLGYKEEGAATVHGDQRGGFVSWQGQWGSLMVFQNILVKIGDDACEDQILDFDLVHSISSNGMQGWIR
jgi:hypothetical protein